VALSSSVRGEAGARLVALRWRRFRLPMRHRFEAAHGALDDREGILVQLVSDDGLVGTGEASPMASIGGGRVEDVEALLDGLGAHLLEGGPLAALPLDGPGVRALRCALDVALLDLEGRRVGRSIAALLDESPAERVRVNAVIGGGTPDDVARFGAEARGAGYEVLKLKVGVGSLDEDIARVRALRDATSAATVRVDANGAWDEAHALEAVARLAALEVELIEQPVAAGEVAALARVRAASSVPIAADEALTDRRRAREVIERGAADLLVVKPMVLGGLRPAYELALLGRPQGLGAFATTTFDSSIGTAAALQLAAALHSSVAHGLGTGEHLAADVTRATLVASEGWLALPDGPGLGIEVDADALERCAVGPWREIHA
jgi:o-succinylbenzoate synthase